jgi:hypothetical protein
MVNLPADKSGGVILSQIPVLGQNHVEDVNRWLFQCSEAEYVGYMHRR